MLGAIRSQMRAAELKDHLVSLLCRHIVVSSHHREATEGITWDNPLASEVALCPKQVDPGETHS